MKHRILLYISLFLQGLCFWRTPIYDPDLGFHLLGGAWVDKMGDVPRSDFINAFNSSWIDYHWFGQWLIYLLYKSLGFAGVQIFCGIVIALLAVVILRSIELCSRKFSPLEGLIYVSAILWILYGTVSTRPTTLAVLLVATALLSLLRKRALIPLAVLVVLCANIHIYWVLIPGLWGAFACFPRMLPHCALQKPELTSFKAWGGLLLLIALGGISPYGVFNPEPGIAAKLSNHFAFVDVSTMPYSLKRWIDELHGGLTRGGPFIWFFLISLALVCSQYTRKGIFARPVPTLLFFGTGLMAIDAAKYIPLFFLFSLPLLYPAYSRFARRVGFKVSEPILSILLSGATIAPLFIAWQSFPLRENNAAQAEIDLRREQPVGICAKIPDLIPQSNEKIIVATYYHFGSWCSWALNQREMPSPFRVTMDGRTQFIPAKFLEDNFSMYNLGPGWEATLKDLNPEMILVGRGQLLGQMLYKLPEEWKLSVVEGEFALFSRTSGRR